MTRRQIPLEKRFAVLQMSFERLDQLVGQGDNPVLRSLCVREPYVATRAQQHVTESFYSS
jgi:hypothetical protein